MSDERERDVVLSPNEFVYILDKTKGIISTLTGSSKMSLSTSDALVVFNEETKRFEEASASEAITKFITIPENWYCVLKNPAKNNEHPRIGGSSNLPELNIGKKINIPGNASFALFPGQMAKVIKGHSLRTNQYLLARVYDNSQNADYEIGELMIIRGDEVPFFIPPTGIEVVPDDNGEYLRQAATLERLEYCILKNENGEKQYIHGPEVVFPEPDTKFVINPENNSYRFKAIELSDISGIYVKVIADYKDGEVTHKAGEELFITGKDQMIYYPRPEHAIIDYEGKVLHHAIAIPAGEGRYVLNRKTGDVKMVRGPVMYLPDPRNEVIVRRKLTKRQCELWYPGNKEVLEYNVNEPIVVPAPNNNYACIDSLSSAAKDLIGTFTTSCCSSDVLNNGFVGQDNAAIESNSGFKRGNTYSKPRTITIDNKFDGVVSIDVWTGYAINVVSKKGSRKTVVGPQTYLLGYDEVLEETTRVDDLSMQIRPTVFLKVDHNRIRDEIIVQTKDFVNAKIYISYTMNFLAEEEKNWFSIEDHIRFFATHYDSVIKQEVKKLTIEEFYNHASEVINECIFAEFYKFDNGMYITNAEIFDVEILNTEVDKMISTHQREIVQKSLELSAAEKEISVVNELEKIRAMKLDLEYQRAMHEIQIKSDTAKEQQRKDEELLRMRELSQKASEEANRDLQSLIGEVHKAELARTKAEYDQRLAFEKERDKLSIEKQKAYTDAVKKVVDSISPDLIAAITTSSKADMLKEVAQSLSPYALSSEDESVADVVNKLLRGTSLEGLVSVGVDKVSLEVNKETK